MKVSCTLLLRSAMSGMMALLLGAACLSAQDAPGRSGFWVSAGLGGGVAPYDMYDAAESVSLAFYLRLGGTPSQAVGLGFESIIWGLQDYSRSNSTFTVMVYPGKRDFFAKVGVGVGIVDLPGAEDQGGYAMTLGTGWDVRLPANLYVTPNLDLMLTVVGTSSVEPRLGPVKGVSSLLLVTIGITWH